MTPTYKIVLSYANGKSRVVHTDTNSTKAHLILASYRNKIIRKTIKAISADIVIN